MLELKPIIKNPITKKLFVCIIKHFRKYALYSAPNIKGNPHKLLAHIINKIESIKNKLCAPPITRVSCDSCILINDPAQKNVDAL
jgi:hypothetical protein